MTILLRYIYEYYTNLYKGYKLLYSQNHFSEDDINQNHFSEYEIYNDHSNEFHFIKNLTLLTKIISLFVVIAHILIKDDIVKFITYALVIPSVVNIFSQPNFTSNSLHYVWIAIALNIIYHASLLSYIIVLNLILNEYFIVH